MATRATRAARAAFPYITVTGVATPPTWAARATITVHAGMPARATRPPWASSFSCPAWATRAARGPVALIWGSMATLAARTAVATGQIPFGITARATWATRVIYPFFLFLFLLFGAIATIASTATLAWGRGPVAWAAFAARATWLALYTVCTRYAIFPNARDICPEAQV